MCVNCLPGAVPDRSEQPNETFPLFMQFNWITVQRNYICQKIKGDEDKELQRHGLSVNYGVH